VIEQQARVIRAEGEMVRVQIGAQSGCTVCDEGRGCGAGLFGKLLNRKPVEIVISNPFAAQAGQTVQLGLSESLFIQLVFRLYGWPLLAGLAGAALGHQWAVSKALTAGLTDLASLVAGVIFGVLVLIFWSKGSGPDISPGDIQLLDKPVAGTACESGVNNNRFENN